MNDPNNLGSLAAWAAFTISAINTVWLVCNGIRDRRITVVEARKSVKTTAVQEGLAVRNRGMAPISDLVLVTLGGMTTQIRWTEIAGNDQHTFPIDWKTFENDAKSSILQYEDIRGRVWRQGAGQDPVRHRYGANWLGRWWSGSKLNPGK